MPSAATIAEAYETLDSLSVQITSPTGVIELEDEANGYSLHGDTFASETYTHRKVEVNSPWLEGTYAVDAVLDNTVEALVVWVSGLAPDGTYSHFLFRTRLNALKKCFDQISYQITRTIGDAVEAWDCEVSDYTVETQQEFLFATRGVLRVPVPRRPTATLTQTTTSGGGTGGGTGGGPTSSIWLDIYLPAVLGLDVPIADAEFVSGMVLGGWPL